MNSTLARRTRSRSALVVAVGTVVTAAVSLVVGITSPPRSGPYCQSDCLAYPYTDVVAFVPRDYWWMYPLLLMVLMTLLLAVAVHGWVSPPRRALSLVGLCLTAVAAAVLVADYGIQLTAVQPALLAGETEGLSLWTQYNPHGVFIALENAGFATLNLGFVFLGSALATTRPRSAAIGAWVFRAGGTLTLAVMVALATIYRAELDYRFEVAAIGLTWLTLITGGLLMAIAFAGTPAGPGPAALPR